MKISGKLLQLLSIESGLSINGPWSKQGIIVETTDDYPKKVCISIWNGRVDISELEVGKKYVFHVNVESKEFKGKWYTELTLWKIGRENTAETGRPMLKILSPLLSGNESNLEILQKFHEEIDTKLSYTKGISIGNEISNEELVVNQSALDFINDFKKGMNNIAMFYISKSINEFLINPETFIKYPLVVQQYFINTILCDYYGYRPEDGSIHYQSPNDIPESEKYPDIVLKALDPSKRIIDSLRDEILKEIKSEDRQEPDFIL